MIIYITIETFQNFKFDKKLMSYKYDVTVYNFKNREISTERN